MTLDGIGSLRKTLPKWHLFSFPKYKINNQASIPSLKKSHTHRAISATSSDENNLWALKCFEAAQYGFLSELRKVTWLVMKLINILIGTGIGIDAPIRGIRRNPGSKMLINSWMFIVSRVFSL